ncbi:MAG TPA: helix-turn-helix transcriptional regulator [Candidatus Coprosoma intestinipullorum]|uniref:Helix-turn-helix transcriptional regulator n=1 Tax=Candidatus Coprosoma intestinipullorum TaxID=2840752 RepID=A0A9D0ZPU7_9FIRM|nr:helix-turn-helix transcriptional regulator [Candidatus Coprosoma intestinipullorum]
MSERENLSQEKFGKILGLPQRTYSSYENNERTLTIEILIKISKITHYSLDYLTGRVNNEKI